MKCENLSKLLSQNSYPGRGIVVGKAGDGAHLAVAYFIMGRSENSRNRVFVPDEDGIKTQAFDPAKLSDPSLILYTPVRVLGDVTIVTNGDQTDTVYDFLQRGQTFEDALRTRSFEPDAPNFTPRVSAMIRGGTYRLSLLRSDGGDGDRPQRFFYEYENTAAGEGHFLHTYRCDGSPIPSFEGEPERVEIRGSLDQFTDAVWDSLNEDNKVSLFTRFIDLRTGIASSRILNKNK